jgi:MFS family permease
MTYLLLCSAFYHSRRVRISRVACDADSYNRFAMPAALVLVLTLSAALFFASKGNRVLVTLSAVDAGAGSLQIGILFALHGLFPLLLAVYAGRIADRFNNKLLIYWGIAGYSFSLAIPYGWPGLSALYFSAAIGGLGNMLFVLAFQNLVGVLSTDATRTRHYSWYALGESFGHGMGPIFIGLCIDNFNSTVTFLIAAVFSALWLAVAILFRQQFPAATPMDAKAATAPGGRRDLLALPAMRMALITNGAFMIGFDLFNLYMPVYGRSLGFSATTIGLIIGAYALAAIITRVLLPSATTRWGERRILILALAVPACAFALIPFTGGVWLLALLAFIIGFGIGCGLPLSMGLAFNAAPEGRSAEAVAMRLAVSYGAHVFIPPLFGALGAVVGLAPVFWLCAATLMGGSMMNMKQVMKTR